MSGEGCGQISGRCGIWNGGPEEVEAVIQMAEKETWWMGENEGPIRLMLGSLPQGW